ncbi:Protein of unknown function (DUF1826) [Thioflavicoccus mobilis 8321]|uniref:DUF1826 domain-containing protein n=1 Tax=Thioflavicoccus mobilis 8321 TaxID=765912 RepID=L0GZ45_9GAMM|nr:DUF1826 domain-containing protein [Thioflavicoccus mobilis]AGA91241.1 Protein of unknown function (DUF1826) [Thioflavicoccus mobilis 8321]
MPSSLPGRPLSPEPPRHLVGKDSRVTHHINEPEVNLTLWRRTPLEAVAREVARLQAADLPDIRCRTSPPTFDADMGALLTGQGLDPKIFGAWRADLRRLADLFFAFCAGREVTTRLETTDVDGCPRFHVDRTHLRLLCTYRGPGTEWLTDAQVDRDAQASGASNTHIIRFGEPSRLEPFWVGILKGDAYPGNAGRGLVHRSPPIAGSGQTRVLFCLDC